MKWLLPLLFLMSSALAQSTNVTANVQDSDGQTWDNGSYIITFVPTPGRPGPYIWNGSPMTPTQKGPYNGVLNGSGVLTVSLPDNSTIEPAGTKWQFSICPNASSPCGIVTTAITGASQNITTLVTDTISPVRFPALCSQAFGYQDLEVTPTPQPGGCYFNVIAGCQRVWSGSSWSCGGTSGIVPVYTPTLPPSSIQGAFGLLYPPTGSRNLDMWNGVSWFNTNPYNSDAGLWGCDNTGATGALACINLMQTAVGTTQGQALNFPRGTFLIDGDFHVHREGIWNGQGAGVEAPGTIFKLRPGYGITFDKSTVSSDGGPSDWTLWRDIRIQGTFGTCTAVLGNATITGCNFNPATTMELNTDDYIVVMGNATSRGSFLRRLFVPTTTQVASTTTSSITFAGGVTSSFSGTVFVMKSGHIVGIGTTTNTSASITGVTNTADWMPGDPILGCGLGSGNFVKTRNTGTNTLVVNVAADAGACVGGNLTKGPVHSVAIHAGSVVLEDVSVDFAAGDGYNNTGAAAWTTVADGNYVNRLRVTNTGGACARQSGDDANTGTFAGIQGTNCAGGGDLDQSFLGNTHIGNQIASGDGLPYSSTSSGATCVYINPYGEGGQQIPSWAQQCWIIGGLLSGGAQGSTDKGNIFTGAGRVTPTLFTRNEQGVSRASCDNASPTLYNVTNITRWNVGDPIIGGCLTTGTVVNAVDTGLATLTLSKNASAMGDDIAITTAGVIGRFGPFTADANGPWGFGYTRDGTTTHPNELVWRDPYNTASTNEMGSFTLLQENAIPVWSVTTAEATASWDYPGTNSRGYFEVNTGLSLGTTSSKVDVKPSTVAAAPTTGFYRRGSIAISTVPSSTTGGVYQQVIAAKSIVGHADTTAGSTALINQDAAFLGGCAPADSAVATGNIDRATTLIDQNTLSKKAKLTAVGVAITCTRQPRAHVITTGDITTTSPTILNFSPTTGWAVNDIVRCTGCPAGSFILSIVGSTVTISQNATATTAGLTISDASFVQMQAVPAAGSLATLIGKGTVALPTGAIASGACANESVSVAGALTTDIAGYSFTSDPGSVHGYGGGVIGDGLNLWPWMAAGTWELRMCNNTAASITPGAITVAYSVTR